MREVRERSAVSPAFCVGTQPCSVAGFVELTRSQSENGGNHIFFCSDKLKAIDFKKQNAGGKACSLIPINERMIAHDAGGVERRQIDDIHARRIRIMLTGPCEGRFQKTTIMKSGKSAVLLKKEGVQGNDITPVNPLWRFPAHFASARKALR